MPDRKSIRDRDSEQFPDQQLSNTAHTIIKSNHDIELSQDASTNVQLDSEIEADQDIDVSRQPEVIHDQSSSPQKLEMFQADPETIRSETTTDGRSNRFYHPVTVFAIVCIGKMGENNTLSFELNHAAAFVLYYPLLPNDPQRDINISLSGKTAEIINDLPYEKTKAQRILAKTISTNTGHPHIGRDTIGTSSSLTTLPMSNSEPIPVKIIIS